MGTVGFCYLRKTHPNSSNTPLKFAHHLLKFARPPQNPPHPLNQKLRYPLQVDCVIFIVEVFRNFSGGLWMNILFVCTGNTCRSPMAEALLKEKYPELDVQSAGVFAVDGAPASPNALQALQEKNIKFNHRSQPVTVELLKWADLVLTMTTQHKRQLIVEYPEYDEKVYTLKEFVAIPNEKEIEQLQKTIENKRRQFIEEHQELTAEQLEEKLNKYVQKETEKLQNITRASQDFDISDPFGGDLEMYRQTRAELEMNIERLVQKIEATKGE